VLEIKRRIEMQYRIRVKTADESGAGTDANLFLVLVGTKRKSQEIRMNSRISGDAFERNSLDQFTHNEDLGWIYEITLRSDNRYSGSGWRPDYIEVESGSGTAEKINARFSLGSWIEDTRTRTLRWSGYGLKALGTRSFQVRIDYATLYNNFHSSLDRKRQTTTVTTDIAFIGRVLEEFDRSETTTEAGISVTAQASASFPIKALQVGLKRSAKLSASVRNQAIEEHKRKFQQDSTRSVMETVLESRTITAGTYQLNLQTAAYSAGLTTYTDGIGAENFLSVKGTVGVDSQATWEFPSSQGQVPLREYERFKRLYKRQANGDTGLLQDLQNFEAMAKEQNWIRGL
jgi:hypothetical protein